MAGGRSITLLVFLLGPNVSSREIGRSMLSTKPRSICMQSTLALRYRLRMNQQRGNRKRLRLETLESRNLLAADFQLELLHFSDQEAGAAAVLDAPNLSAVLSALRAQDLGGDSLPDNTLTLSSGDSFIPGLFFDASTSVFGSGGVADIKIQNALGVQAMSLGNHEFDFGTSVLAGLISGTAGSFEGAQYPYLSGNLNFSSDANLAPLVVSDAGTPQPNSLSGRLRLAEN
jgi:2',3'-cyclic-nucleotide 2'-phosphodiesterase (5'-nucleotidase family)